MALKPESYPTATVFDALDRPVSISSPDGSITNPVFNEANLLNEVNVNIKGAAKTVFVSNIDYDAKRQRQRIDYGNDTFTTYEHDPKTYRLKRLTTRRAGDTLQDLQYTYDPIGNITFIRDDAQQTIYFNNAGVEPHNDFEYDALYRLIKGSGREHIAGGQPPDESDGFRMTLPHPGDMTAIQAYDQRYEYDAVGNMLKMIHRAGSGSITNHWTREFTCNPENPNPALRNNQLTSTTVGGTTLNYTYDVHGNIENLPHLSGMSWDFKNQLESIDKGGGGKVYYNYDAGGNRVRKVWEKPGGLVEERLYLGMVEIYTKTQGATLQLRRETLHVMDDKQRIALIDTRTDSLEQLIRYQYSNHLDTANLELDAAAAIISYEEYYPFGSTSYQAGRSAAEVSLKRYRYTAKERDEESGLYYHGARYYAPWLARWTAADPIGIKDGLNIYAYTGNNPVKLKDPTGNYGEGGHFYTVYFLSLAAGFDEKTAFKNAVYAQMPDELISLDATEQEIATIGIDLAVGKNDFPSETLLNMQSEQHAQRDLIHKGLHSLTGKSSKYERNITRSALMKSTPGTLEFGFLLHRFGDTYAHSMMNNQKKVYHTGIGHFLNWHDPDQIHKRPDLYKKYARDLYKTLSKIAVKQGLKPQYSEEQLEKALNEITDSTVRKWYIRSPFEDPINVKATEAKQIEKIRQLSIKDFWVFMRPYAPESADAKSWEAYRKEHPELVKGISWSDISTAVYNVAKKVGYDVNIPNRHRRRERVSF